MSKSWSIYQCPSGRFQAVKRGGGFRGPERETRETAQEDMERFKTMNREAFQAALKEELQPGEKMSDIPPAGCCPYYAAYPPETRAKIRGEYRKLKKAAISLEKEYCEGGDLRGFDANDGILDDES